MSENKTPNAAEQIVVVSSYRKDVINSINDHLKANHADLQTVVGSTSIVDDYIATLAETVIEKIDDELKAFVSNPENKKRALEWSDLVATVTGHNRYFTLNKLTQKPLSWAYDYAKEKLNMLEKFGFAKQSPTNHNEWILCVDIEDRIKTVTANFAFFGNLFKKELEGCRDLDDATKERVQFEAFRILENIKPVEMTKNGQMTVVKKETPSAGFRKPKKAKAKTITTKIAGDGRTGIGLTAEDKDMDDFKDSKIRKDLPANIEGSTEFNEANNKP